MVVTFAEVHGFLMGFATESLSVFDLGLILASFFTAIMYLIVLALKPYDKEAKEQEKYLLKSQLDQGKVHEESNQGFGVFLQMILIATAYCLVKAGWFNTSKGLLQLSWQDDSTMTTQNFNKPLLVSWTVSAGLSLLAPFSGLSVETLQPDLRWKFALIALMGFLSVTFFSYGMLYLSMSTIMIIRIGGTTIFTAAGSHIAGMSPLNGTIAASVGVVTGGTLLAFAARLSGFGDAPVDLSLAWGVTLAMISTACTALSNVMEEIIFAQHERVDALQFSVIVSVFGTAILGVMMMAAQFIPGNDNGVQEDTVDSLRKLLTSEARGALGVLLLLSVVLGAAGQWVHKLLTRLYGATATRLLSNLQFVTSWLLAVVVFYAFQSDPILHGLGEEWEWVDAACKAAGGALIVAGNYFYFEARAAARAAAGLPRSGIDAGDVFEV